MAIEKYTTDALLLKEYPSGESDAVFKMFTRDFGLCMAHAKSVRLPKSKLRAHLLISRETRVTLVKGKEVWRIVGAEEKNDLGDARHMAFSLIERFVRGDTPMPALYDTATEYLHSMKVIPHHEGPLTLHYLFLVHLGYADALVSGAPSLSHFLSWNIVEHLTSVTLRRGDVRKHVHSILSQMQL